MDLKCKIIKLKDFYYVISDREIKEGDWVIYYDIKDNPDAIGRVLIISKTNGYIRTTLNEKWLDYNSPPKRFKKIEATTDSLHLHRYYYVSSISKEFIEKYVKQYNIGEPIVDVMLKKYVYDENLNLSNKNNFGIETREDNTVIIHPVKSIYTRDEVLEILEGALQHIMKKAKDIISDNSSIEEWFNKNY